MIWKPDKVELPERGYKYLPPERLDLLTHSRVRISQKDVVNDTRDFDPAVLDFAPVAWIERVLPELLTEEHPPGFTEKFLALCKSNPTVRSKMLATALQSRKAIHEYGMLS